MLLAVLLAVIALGHFASPVAAAETADDPHTNWFVLGADVPHRIETPAAPQRKTASGPGPQPVQITAGAGTFIHLAHPIGQARIIDELVPGVWIKSDRSGLQLMARVVLPRTVDPKTQRPATTLLRGTTYSKVGRWQRLSVEQLPLQLSRHVRALRSQLGSKVDSGEAYCDLVVLNAYGGRGVTNVWIDDLQVRGHVAADRTEVRPAAMQRQESTQVGRTSAPSPARTDGPSYGAPGRTGSPSYGPNSSAGRVHLQGAVLTVGGRPFFPRMIEHRGESFEYLQSLGFNAVRLSSPPTGDQRDEARRLGMWLVCPPPNFPAGQTIGPEYRNVLAWDLGRRLSHRELESTRRRADVLRRAEGRDGRPLFCSGESDLRAYSRHVDLLLAQRPHLATSLDLADYATWLRRRPHLARPGTPIWAAVDTEPAIEVLRQVTALSSGRPENHAAPCDQIRLSALMAVTAGARGLCFKSRTPLDAGDGATRLRADSLAMVNAELSLIEPWAVAGSFVTTAAASDPEIRATLLATDRAKLLLAVREAPFSQYIVGPASRDVVSLVVPGIPQSNSMYELTPAGVRSLRPKRVTGGVRVTLEDFSLVSMIIITPDPLVVNRMAQRLAASRRQAARRIHRVAAGTLGHVEQIHRQLIAQTSADPRTEAWLARARASLRQSEFLLKADDPMAAQLDARKALRALGHVQRIHWQRAEQTFASPTVNPFVATFATLPRCSSLAGRVRASQPGQNLLAGGDFEDLHQMLRAGWRHSRYHARDVQSDVELAAADRRSGRFALRIRAMPADRDNVPGQVETPPVWIESPPVHVRAGQLVQITGFVKLPVPVTGSVDGLLIYDSLGGRPLGARLKATDDWQPLVMYRAADRDTTVTVTFALTGLGEALLDDVAVATLQPTTVQTPPTRDEQARRLQAVFGPPRR